MPIVYIQREGRSTPVVICDHCKSEITRASDGNCEWKPDDELKGAQLYFTHKKCCAPFEAQTEDHYCAVGLDMLPVYLAKNLKMDWEESLKRAVMLSQIEF